MKIKNLKNLILITIITGSSVFAQAKHEVQFVRKTASFGTDLQRQVNDCFDHKSCEGVVLPPGYFILDRTVSLPDGFSLRGFGEGKTIISFGKNVKNSGFINSKNSTGIYFADLVLDLGNTSVDSKINAISVRTAKADIRNLEIRNARANALSITGSSTAPELCSLVTLSNIFVNKTATTSASGIFVSNCKNIIADKLHILGSQKDGLVFDRVSSSTIQNSLFEGNVGNGISLVSVTGVDIVNSTSTKNLSFGINISATTTKTNVTGSAFIQNQKSGLNVSGKGLSDVKVSANNFSQNRGTGASVTSGSNITFERNNFFQNESDAISVTGVKKINISSNKFSENKADSVQIGNLATLVKIIDNEILDSGHIATDTKVKTSGINLTKGAENIIVEGNSINNMVGSSTDIGLSVGNGVSKVFAKNNTIDKDVKIGVNIGNDTTSVCVYGDKSMTAWKEFKCFFQNFVTIFSFRF